MTSPTHDVAPSHDRPVKPQLSIMVANFAERPASWQPVLDLARDADRAGIDRLAVSEHVVFGEHLEAYGNPSLGGTAGGQQPTSPDGHWLEPLTLLSVIAGTTSHIRLATAVLLAALRPATLLAKQTATLDVISGGRLDLGVGVGWQREEYDACGVEFDRRGAVLDRSLEICRLLWTQRVTSFDDGELRFDNVHMMPKPVQAGGVPIWVSGRVHARTVARTVRFGSGWIPWGDDAVDPSSGILTLQRAFTEAGRDPTSLQVQTTLPSVTRQDGSVDVDATIERVGPLAEIGVTDFRVRHPWTVDPVADLELMEGLVTAFRAAVGRSDREEGLAVDSSILSRHVPQR